MDNSHECRSNKLSARILLIGAALCLIIIGLGYLGVATTPVHLLWRDFGIAAACLAIPYGVLRVTAQDATWHKYVVAVCTVCAVLVIYSDFEISRHVLTALVIPLIIVSVYFDQRLTLITGAITLVLANLMDVINGATVFTPVQSVDGRNVILVESPQIVEDLIYLDLGFALIIGGFVVIADRSRKLFDGLARAEDSIREAANHDALTGLPNFNIFQQKMQQAFAHAKITKKKMSAIVIGVGRLHDIRQALGHGVADEVTAALGTRIARRIPEGSTVAKLEGDEFAVILPDMTDDSDARTCAQRIIDELEPPVDIKGSKAIVDTYIGISIFPDTSDNASAMVRQAQAAMLQARSGRESAYRVFDLEADEKSRRNSAMEGDLRRAIDEDELVVFLQPKVDSKTGVIVAAEALVRWIKPGEGMVSPGEFIPLAERTGLIVDVDAWVMKTACRQVKELHDMGHKIRLSVNVSYQDFSDSDLPAIVIQAIGESGLPHESLELEITESVAMSDVDKVCADLDIITSRGSTASIDDFGTGYSSLSYMKHFPISTIKIDQSFIRGIGVSPTDEAIITMTTDMAHHLGLHVVAEGVETDEQLKFVREREIDEVQGFYFYRPMPIKELIEALSPSVEPKAEEVEADTVPA